MRKSNRHQITVDPPEVSGDTVRFRLRISRSLRKYFLKDLSYVQYKDVDLKQVDISILPIPLLCAIAPMAWAVGANVHVAELDASYLESLAKIKEVYRQFQYNFSFAGEIVARKVVWNKSCGTRTGLFFSGGVDSLTSYLKHKASKPDFISIWGLPDIPPFESRFWKRMWTDICLLANMDGVAAFQVKTDMLRNINHELLTKEFGFNWFLGAAFGLFIAGFAAPLTAIRNIGTIIIASSYTEDYKGRAGSHPQIEGNLKWANTKVAHDAFELSRQQKLQYLCQDDDQRYLSHLRVCWDSALATNCGDCEKCMRTITGLAIEGRDPNSCNFSVDSRTFSLMRDRFCKGEVALGGQQLFMWEDIQKHIPAGISEDIYGSREFLTWLKNYDLSRYKVNRLNKLLWDMRRLHHYKRKTTPSVLRKLKAYCYIGLSRLKLL